MMAIDLHRSISLDILPESVLVQLVLLDVRLRSSKPILGFPDMLLLVRLETSVPKIEFKPNTSQERKNREGSDEPKGKTHNDLVFFFNLIWSVTFSQRTYKDQFLTTHPCEFL